MRSVEVNSDPPFFGVIENDVEIVNAKSLDVMVEDLPNLHNLLAWCIVDGVTVRPMKMF